MPILHVALWQPEIPPNTGNIARLCAATGCPLHLIGRLGFRLDDKHLRRAGLDYWPHVDLRRHDTMADFEASFPKLERIFCLSARASRPYTQIGIQAEDCLLFGSESGGLPAEVLERHGDRAFVIPMPRRKVRSLNLATAVGIVLYDGLSRLHSW
jgi:tRNA (cytidine/uridine-2'-O-)-methyltransferase